jgi:hypothetical protein
MHDITEGLFPLGASLELLLKVHLELLLKVHIKEIPRYSLESFNDFLTREAPIPASDKPNPIGDKLDVAGKQSNSQMLSIMRALPIFYLRIEAAQDEHWKCMLLLIRITQLTFSPVSTQGLISDLKKAVIDYHGEFIRLYPANFRPKLHFLTHYPSQLEKFGPLRNHMCFTHESRHRIVKNVRWFNFRNLPMSVINHLAVDMASRIFLPSGELRSDLFATSASFSTTSPWKAAFNGIDYQVGDVIALSETPVKYFQMQSFSTKEGRLLLTGVKLQTQVVSSCNLFEVDGAEASPSLTIFADQLVLPWPVRPFTVNSKHFLHPLCLSDLSHL